MANGYQYRGAGDQAKYLLFDNLTNTCKATFAGIRCRLQSNLRSMNTKLFDKPLSVDSITWVKDFEAKRPYSGTLADDFPIAFPKYARLLHPAKRQEGNDLRFVRWQEVAGASNTETHRLMQFPNIARIPYRATAPTASHAPWDLIPSEGNLPIELTETLVAILRRYTASPTRCWFAVWDGHGFDGEPWMQAAPLFRFNGLNFRLFTGPIDSATESFSNTAIFPQSANMWWPEDCAWFVVSHIDLNSTYIGGSEEAIGAILQDERLEAFQAKEDDDVGLGGDIVNPPVS